MTVREALHQVLTSHYMLTINREPRQQSNPVCACSVYLGWHPSDASAVEAWAKHVIGVLLKLIREAP